VFGFLEQLRCCKHFWGALARELRRARNQNNGHHHHHYQFIDLGTFGGCALTLTPVMNSMTTTVNEPPSWPAKPSLP
jgi:hypothetical protein